jgi:hypothetical protein
MPYRFMLSGMQKVTYATLAAITVAMAFAVLPALIQQQASAVPAPKTEEVQKCSDPKFADRESCPGKSEDASGGDRDDINECTPRNPGQAKNCPTDSTVTDPVNPP